MAGKEFQISIESARIKVGPFTLDLSQDVFVPKPAVPPANEFASGPEPAPTAIARLECLTCHEKRDAYQLSAVLDFMRLHQHHDISVESLE